MLEGWGFLRGKWFTPYAKSEIKGGGGERSSAVALQDKSEFLKCESMQSMV